MRFIFLGITLFATTWAYSGPAKNGVDKKLLSQIRLDSGSKVMVKQYANEKKLKKDVYVTIHCPHPYDKCQTIHIQEAAE